MRILLKISGEALKGEKDFGIDPIFVERVVETIKQIKNDGHEVAIVVGSGNIYRGGVLIEAGVDASDSHNLSMLATVINGVVLKDFLEKNGIKSVVMDPNGIKFIEKYNKDKAKDFLKEKKVVIFTGGTGNPFFTTDTGGVLRAIETKCDLMIKATKVDGIYSSDPEKNSDAKFYENISYKDFIKKDLKVMDLTAIAIAKENNLKIRVLKLFGDNSIIKAINGENEGSLIN